jgi:LacI family transcriptional regulator
MKDVAREAGVALGTVSKVVNGIPVGEDYKSRVDRAIAKLNYQVNDFAKSLKIAKTLTIALIIPNIYNTFYSSIAESLNMELSKRGYRMLLCTTDRGDEQSIMTMMSQNRADGIIVLSYSTKLDFPEGLPVVSIDRRFSPDISCVSSDNYGGGQIAAAKLYALGCRRLAFLGTATDVETEVTKRRDGFVSYCRQQGISFEECFRTGADDFAPLADFLDSRIRRGKPAFDGIFAISDACGYQVMRYLSAKGLHVPEDLQLIGYDGIRKFGYFDYFCSTIVQPVEDIARACVELVLREKGTAVPSLLCLPVHFEEGGTTTPQR